MISQDQKNLSDYVKEVHLSLRRRTQEIGAEKAWEEHLQNEDVLRKYANSMMKLSENFWVVNNREVKSLLCRNDWMIKCINAYFREGGRQKEIEKEWRKMTMFFTRNLIDECEIDNYKNFKNIDLPKSRIKVLDVGSCYNPLQKYSAFLDVYPIDLYPAIPEVKKCNFIDVHIEDMESEIWFTDIVSVIPTNFFDVVIFSLVLEYIPSPKQRFIACTNAYKCLKTNGLLLIITPDSKHESANASLMKSWKMAAAGIGFNRTCLEKLKYLYCMAFRKSISSKYPLLLSHIKPEDFKSEEMFIIPQDFINYKVVEPIRVNSKDDEIAVKGTFDELPFA